MKVSKWPSRKSIAFDPDTGDKLVVHKSSKDCMNCTPLLKHINRAFKESELYRHNKEYIMAVRSLKCAYTKTFELEEAVCKGCTAIFRKAILELFEVMEDELLNMTTSMFRKKDYLGSLLLVRNTLWELQKNMSGAERE